MGDFINKLQEEPIPENGDFLVFDIIDIGLGQTSTKKISYRNFSSILSSNLISNTQSKINNLSNSVSDFQTKLFYKLDKRGLSYNLSERMTGSLNVNSVLSCFEIAHFNKDLNSNVNKIINLSAQSFTDYDGVNKKYVDDIFSTVPVINMSLFVLKSGDRMTGYLNLTSSVFNTNDAINKKYVDEIFNTSNEYLAISGGVMSGYLNVLKPLINNHTASKEYVDSLKLSTSDYLSISGGLLNDYLNVLSPTVSSHVSTKKYVDDLSDKYVKLTGSQVTPNFVSLNYLFTNPLSNWAITKQYVDDSINTSNEYLAISGGVMSGYLNVLKPLINNHTASKEYVDSLSLSTSDYLSISGGVLNDYLNVLSPTVSSHVSTKKYVDDLSDKYVKLTGSRVTPNFLTLDYPLTNPLSNWAITKQYVDDSINTSNEYLAISGGVMSGYLNVLKPLSTNHTASKEYVDSLRLLASDYLSISGGTLNDYLNVLSPTVSSHVSTKKYVDDLSDKYVKLTGSQVTPNFVTLNYPLTDALSNWAITKQYVDDTFNNTNRYVPISGNKALSGDLITHDVFTQNNELVNKNYVDTLISTENVKLTGDTASNPQLKRFTEKLITINHTTNSNISLNSNLGNSFFINLSGNCTGFDTININPNNVYYMTLNVIQKPLTEIVSDVIAIAAGSNHSLFLKNDGTVWSCGENSVGNLGDGTTTNKSIPIQVTGLTNITAIAAGGNHSLFLRSNGTVWSCGFNNGGQLGDGTTTNKSIPVQVTGLTNITAIAAGSNHSLFLKNDGTVWSCGSNSFGQLGNGTTTPSSTPVQIPTLTNITAIDAGGYHSLFLKNDGTAWSCGYNNHGQLGDNTWTDKSTPVQVSTLSDIIAIAAGGSHNLFLRSGLDVWSCGLNTSGQLGNQSIANKNTPVFLNSNNTQIAAGGAHSLILKNTGEVVVCGNDANGQLGVGGTIGDQTGPGANKSLSVMQDATLIAAGGASSFFLKNKLVFSCGINNAGQLGNGTSTTLPTRTPAQVSLTRSNTTYRTVNWSINGYPILWEKANISIPTITQTADKVDVFTLIHKGGTWYGINAGQNR